MAFMKSAWPSTKGIASFAHRSASQYQVKMHSQATTRPSRYGAIASRKASGVVGRLRSKAISPAASRTHTYIVCACRSIPQE